MKYLILGLLLLMACSTAPYESLQSCENYCSEAGYKTAALITIEDGIPCKRCKCFQSLHELLEYGTVQ